MDAERRDRLAAYRFSQSKNSWNKTSLGQRPTTGIFPSSIKIVTWNIDFMSKYIIQRVRAVLKYVQHDVFQCPEGQQPVPCAILFQEVHAQALDCIVSNQWIREHFMIAPVAPVYSSQMPRIFFAQQWPPADWLYGNITLISRTIPVIDVISLLYLNSEMDRNALIVDLLLTTPDPDSISRTGGNGEDKGKGKNKAETITLRIANTHLESLSGHGTIVRPFQMQMVSKILQENIHGGIVCGDMNAIEESDKNTPAEVGLVDAYSYSSSADRIGVGAAEEDSSGYTWGYQPLSEFPPNRLDKILYTQNETFTVGRPERIGVNEKIEEEDLWVSDHYGLVTTIQVLAAKR